MLKKITLAIGLLMVNSVLAADFGARISDPAWDGKTVPKGQQCNRFGGKAMTPKLSVDNIPVDATAIILEFDDRTYQPMNHGGHGKLRYNIKAGIGNVEVPSAPPHTFDLPDGFYLVAAHKAPTWDTAGAYMPPCSGGGGNKYAVVVKAVTMDGDKIGETLAKVSVLMGRY